MSYPQAVAGLLDDYAGNGWFVDSYWPENEPRVKKVFAHIASGGNLAGQTLLEVGCANGFMALLFQKLGFAVSAVDACDYEDRKRLFEKYGVAYRYANLNEAQPLSAFADGAFDVVTLGEVFEHILNHPVGLLREIFRVLKPGGRLVLTMPNPSTLMNSLRLLNDRYLLWGTDEFLRQAKFEDGKIIDKGEIHYREYPAWLTAQLMQEVGFTVDDIAYVPTGSARTQPALKRLVKRLLFSLPFAASSRLLSPGYVISAARPQSV